VASVTFDGVSKVYDNGFRAVDDLDLEIEDGEFMVLVGPSGCGKTTALRMLAGLEDISEGELVIDDQVVNNVAPQKRDIAMVFQNYALYPHLTTQDSSRPSPGGGG
jgi:multiple sugar transport system ATP-binding protein